MRKCEIKYLDIKELAQQKTSEQNSSMQIHTVHGLVDDDAIQGWTASLKSLYKSK